MIETGFGSLFDLEFHIEWSMEEAAEVMNLVYNSWVRWSDLEEKVDVREVMPTLTRCLG